MLIDRSADVDGLRIVAGKVDGMIITDIMHHDDRVNEISRIVPVGVFGPTDLNLPSLDLDEHMGMRLAFEHLKELGSVRIGLVTSKGLQRYLSTRLELYTQLMAESGAELRVVFGSHDVAGGYGAMRSFPELPEAILCVNGIMAFGVIRYLQDRDVPLMPMVGCFDDGYLARSLIDFIERGEVRHELAQPELMIRSSTFG